MDSLTRRVKAHLAGDYYTEEGDITKIKTILRDEKIDTHLKSTLKTYIRENNIADAVEMLEKPGMIGWADNHHSFIVAANSYDDAFRGKFDDEADFARHMVHEGLVSGIGDETKRRYLDFEAIAKDLFHDYTFINGYVFCDV